MPSRTYSSSSMTTISLPPMRFGTFCSTVAAADVILVGSAIGTSMAKRDPLPMVERSRSGWSSRRTMRLTVASPVNLLNGSTTWIELDASQGTNDVLASTGSLIMNGTLTVTNIGGSLAAGQSYKLFSGALAGNFGTTNLPALGGGLSWNWNPATGTLSIVGGGVNTTPTNIVSSVAGGNLTRENERDALRRGVADHLGEHR